MLMVISCMIAVLRVVAVLQTLEQSQMSLISLPLAHVHHNRSLLKYMFKTQNLKMTCW